MFDDLDIADPQTRSAHDQCANAFSSMLRMRTNIR